MKTLGLIACLLASGCLYASAQHSEPASQPQPAKPVAVEPPQAFITSKAVVYREGMPIDLTFSVAVPKEGKIVPNFKIETKSGEAIGPRPVRGKYLWEAQGTTIDGRQRDGAITAPVKDEQSSGSARQHTETIANLRDWYELDALGMYTITFDGEWIDDKRESHEVSSNEIIVQLVGPNGEIEPGGEPIQSREIPLAEIWALDMPGTKPMNTAVAAAPDGDHDIAPEGAIVREILRAINRQQWPPRNAAPGFAVHGRGMEALREAHAVLVHGQQPRTQFRAGEQISLVFFSRSIGRYVHIDRVEFYDATVQISYNLVAHETDEVTSHLALIPMTISENAVIQVEIRPMIEWNNQIIPPPSLDHLFQRICHPFSFSVVP